MHAFPLSDLIAATGGALRGPARGDRVVERVVTDSRQARPGDVFFALRGESHDGHAYVGEVLSRGAVAAVVSRGRCGEWAADSLVDVEDPLRALGELARWYRQQRDSLVIGITGSVGKTSTRGMLEAVLSERFEGVASPGNYNNEIGLPLSLLQLEERHEFGVFEMGASRIGDIRALCAVAAPEVGVLTKVGLAHLETFGGPEQIYQGKGELLEALPPHGFAVLGGDDEKMRAMAGRARCPSIFVGERPGNHVRGMDVEVGAEELRFTVDGARYVVPASGRQYLTAALCALAVAREIGMESGAIAAGMLRFRPERGRCRAERVGPWTVIDDSYNANPTSMRAACETLSGWSGAAKRLLVAGDMLELGAAASRLHWELGQQVAAEARVDGLMCLGPHAADVAAGALAAGYPRQRIAACKQMESLLAVLDCWLEPGAVVLVKGSRGMRMERVVDWMKSTALGVESNNELEKHTRPERRAVA